MKLGLLFLYFFSVGNVLVAMNVPRSIKSQLEKIHQLEGSREQRDANNVLENILEQSQDEILDVEDIEPFFDPIYKLYTRNLIRFGSSVSKLRLLVDAALHQGIRGFSYDILLKKIENILKKDRNKYKERSINGRQMLENYYSPQLIKKIHLSNDHQLIDLFIKYLPTPSSSLFEGGRVPLHIAKRQAETDALLKEFVAGQNINTALTSITFIQRKIRAQLREGEQRINIRDLLNEFYNYFSNKIPQADQDKMILDAQFPYIPKCSPELAHKIVEAATKVSLWEKVRHLTAPQSLASIMDNGIMGRRNLLNLFLNFRPASLYYEDIKNGDGNVVCLGPDKIDEKAYGDSTAEIIFDFSALAQEKNPACFYKSQDLGFAQDEYKKIELGDLSFSFNQKEGKLRCAIPGAYHFSFNWSGSSSQKADFSSYPFYPQCLLIFEKIAGLDTVLSLYPFRFIDELPDYYKQRIYNFLDSLNEEELIEKLTEFATKATDAAEFNFYGCYLPSFDHILEINFFEKKSLIWTLKLNDLYAELNVGQTELLNKISNDLPRLLQSYRFIEFLLSKVRHEDTRLILLKLRANCKYPSWHPSFEAANL